MKIFIAGATGAIGGRLVPQLVGVTAVRSSLDVDFGARHLVASGADR